MSGSVKQVSAAERFAFGKNWQRFLNRLDEERIRQAERSLQRLFDADRLDGKSFLDAGSGSGLFSLAARRLGARVHSFDDDPESVACAQELKRRYVPDDPDWTIDRASVLDEKYLDSLPRYDLVYAWGVLHHTGAMWEAMELVQRRVAPDGSLCVSIYNDQGGASRRWATIKRLYNRSPRLIRGIMIAGIGTFFELRSAAIRLVRLQNPLPFRDWAEKKKDRGMSPWHDLIDWVGGYPFEVAKPEEVFEFCRDRGFTLVKLKTQVGGYGCNEFLFRKRPNV